MNRIRYALVRVGLITLFLITILGEGMSSNTGIDDNVALSPYIKKLPNGVTLIFQNIPNVGVVTVQSFVKTGSVNEVAKISGISHFLEHILFKGTKNFAPGEIDTYLDSLGGMNNAFTSSDLTNYYITIPSENVEAAFKVVSDMVFNALFITDEIEKEKPVVVQEIKRKYDDPSYKMWQDLLYTLFQGTPYEREVIGTIKSVTALDKKTLTDYYNKFYHPENMFLTVVGDINRDEVEKLALKYFNLKRDVDADKGYRGDKKIKFVKSVNKVFEADITMAHVVFAFPTGKKDIKTIYTQEVLSEILAGGEYSLFNEILKNEKQLVIYTTDISLDHQYNGLMGAFAVTLPENTDKFRDEAINIIKDIAKGNIDNNRIEKAKNRLKSSDIYSYEKVSSLAINLGYAYTLDMEDYHLNYVKMIDKVSKEDISNYAKELLEQPMYYAKTINSKSKDKDKLKDKNSSIAKDKVAVNK